MIGKILGFAGNALGLLNSNRQYKQQRKDNIADAERQQEYNKELMGMSHQYGKEMFDYTYKTYGDKKNEMEAAGLNPALMYSGGATGGGGSTTAPEAAAGMAAPASRAEYARMGLNMLLQKAQIEATQAEADKTKAEAENIRGVEREESQARTTNLLQDVNNKKAQEIGQQIANRLNSMEEFEKGATQKERIDQIIWNANKSYQELQIANDQAYISSRTWSDQVIQIQEASVQAILKSEADALGVEINKEELEMLKQNMKLALKADNRAERETIVKEKSQELQHKFPTTGGVLGRILNKTVEQLESDKVKNLRDAWKALDNVEYK